MEAPPIPARDLDHILAHTVGLWEDMRGQSIFMTGGTGFFGKWLTASFCRANDQLGLGAHLCILTRDPERAMKMPIYHHPSITLAAGDLRSLAFPYGEFSHVIHAMTAPAGELLFGTNLAATMRLLDFATRAGVKRFLNVSSGAVYGPQPIELPAMREELPLAPDTTRADLAYGHSKRASEFLVFSHAERVGYCACSARCFAFVGPHLPLDANFAIGNFFRDALAGGQIHVHGDGTPIRSYLYMADLAIWLWTILLRGQAGESYNVGSELAVSVGQLAKLVAEIVSPGAEVIVAQEPEPGKLPHRYVPSTSKVRLALQLAPWIGLQEAIARTAAWYREAQ